MARTLVKVVVALALSSAACGADGPQSEVPATSSTSSAPTATTATSAPLQAAMCDNVAFTPNSEDGASDITATGLTCDEAEAFVRVAGRRTSSGGPPSVTVDGFRCVMTEQQDDPLPRAFYECTSEGRKVTFVRS